jgi:putative tricarboxylic transport membrane protein
VATTKSASWQEALKKNDWTPAVLTGDEFGKFVEAEFASLRAIMHKAGMV